MTHERHISHTIASDFNVRGVVAVSSCVVASSAAGIGGFAAT
jgi:hypothetical protein